MFLPPIDFLIILAPVILSDILIAYYLFMKMDALYKENIGIYTNVRDFVECECRKEEELKETIKALTIHIVELENKVDRVQNKIIDIKEKIK